jgi:Secretion system C-terminal sorting domain
MKKIILLFLFLAAFGFTNKAQVLNCGNFCILSIDSLVTSDSTLNVTIYNGDTNQVNYPIVIVTNSTGDTVANIDQLFYFFEQPAGDTLVHTIRTSLTSIPVGFTGTVYITDPLYHITCSHSYPMSCTVGINELVAANSISIYPNPSEGDINISLGDLKNNEALITLFDATGKMVRSISTYTNQSTLERGDLAKGIYFMRVLIGDKQLTKKLILQ